jgi:Lon protease-like protein
MSVESGRLRVFPLNTVLFPGAVLNLHVFEPRYKQMISECLADGEPFGVALIRDGDEAGDPNVVPHDVGTTAAIGNATPLEHGRYYVNTVGQRRFRIERVIAREPYLLADVSYLSEDPGDNNAATLALVDEVRDVFGEYLRLLVEFSGMRAEVDFPPDPIDASFLIGDALQVADSMKQRLLELSSTEQRLAVELEFLRRLLPQLRALLERRRSVPEREAPEQPLDPYRASQERFFGKHFSSN